MSTYLEAVEKLLQDIRRRKSLYSALLTEYLIYKSEQFAPIIGDGPYILDRALCLEAMSDGQIEKLFAAELKKEEDRCLQLFIESGEFGRIDYRTVIRRVVKITFDTYYPEITAISNEASESSEGGEMHT